MKVEFGHRTWQVDVDGLMLSQAEAITAHTGMTLTGWERSLADPEHPGWLESMRCLYWLMLAQNGDPQPMAGLDFEVLAYAKAFADAAAAEAEAAAESDAEAEPEG